VTGNPSGPADPGDPDGASVPAIPGGASHSADPAPAAPGVTTVNERAAAVTSAPGAGALLRVLGLAFGLAIVIGNTIGMGILRTPGEVAAHLPSVPLFLGIWVAGAAYALLGALSVAELGAMHPRSGGLYPLARRGLGPYPAFVVGWTDWLATCGSMAAVAIVLGEYSAPLISRLLGQEAYVAAGVIIAFAVLQWRGIRVSDAAQQATSLAKAVALIGLAAVALVLGSGAGAADATPGVQSAISPSSLSGGLVLAAAIVLALQSVIFTYDGWTGPVFFGEEVQNPGRDIPRAMIGGVVLVMFIYLALNIAFLRVIPIHEMAGDPFVAATAAARLFGPKGDTVLRLLMIVSLIAAVNALLLMASRVPFAMSRDGFLPALLQRVNAGGTPLPALLLSTVVGLLFIATNTFDSALALLAFFFVANYGLCFVAVFVLRIREPDAPRPFRIPGYPLVPALALGGSLAFLVAAILGDRANSVRSLVLLAVSLPVYLAARSRRKAPRV
jgi:basic amino acid/polyamine antiporter, APA family